MAPDREKRAASARNGARPKALPAELRVRLRQRIRAAACVGASGFFGGPGLPFDSLGKDLERTESQAPYHQTG